MSIFHVAKKKKIKDPELEKIIREHELEKARKQQLVEEPFDYAFLQEMVDRARNGVIMFIDKKDGTRITIAPTTRTESEKSLEDLL